MKEDNLYFKVLSEKLKEQYGITFEEQAWQIGIPVNKMKTYRNDTSKSGPWPEYIKVLEDMLTKARKNGQ